MKLDEYVEMTGIFAVTVAGSGIKGQTSALNLAKYLQFLYCRP
jgi:hypothetical protein